jgi:hypothetical protein
VPPDAVVAQEPPGDPDAARDLVEQFEAGVQRALHETRPDQP